MKFSGKRLQDAMQERGMTERELGRAIGRAYQTVNAWKLGDTTPNADDIPKLATALDKSLSFFYTDDDNSCHDHSADAQPAPAAAGETNGEDPAT